MAAHMVAAAPLHCSFLFLSFFFLLCTFSAETSTTTSGYQPTHSETFTPRLLVNFQRARCPWRSPAPTQLTSSPPSSTLFTDSHLLTLCHQPLVRCVSSVTSRFSRSKMVFLLVGSEDELKIDGVIQRTLLALMCSQTVEALRGSASKSNKQDELLLQQQAVRPNTQQQTADVCMLL